MGFRANSRLCHGCRPKWRRYSRDQCAECSDNTRNWLLMLLGLIIILAALVALVLNAIKEAGRTTTSESIQKVIINYAQVAALFQNFPLRWPSAVIGLFQVQGAVSTLGEHLINPDCVSFVSYRTEAELHYAKQVGYVVLPWALIVVSYAIWNTYAWKKGIDFHQREERSDTHAQLSHLTPKDKFVVSLCVVIYLLYPTLCTQGFSLFNCIRVGKNDDDFFFMVE